MGAHDYWTMATEYLGLVEAAAGELVKSENAWVVVGDESVVDNYADLTKWSDHRIGVPLLFNLLHGVELMLKGFLALKGPVPNTHRLTDLHAKFDALFPASTLGTVVFGFLVDPDPTSPFGKFLDANGIKVDDWYQALKYPTSTSGSEFDHVSLHYGSESTLPFWDEVRRTAIEVRTAAVDLARELGEV